MDQEGVEREALELACEDWFGIWELLWGVNSDRPELSPDDRANLATDALRRLRDRGHIRFIRVPWPGPSGSEEYASLPIEEVEAELERQGWKQVPPASDVWFGATPEGEAAYRSRDPATFR